MTRASIALVLLVVSGVAIAAPVPLDKLGPLSTATANGDSLPRGFAVVNGAVLFFSAQKKGLWRTDGTPQGTTLIRDLDPVIDSFQETPHIVTLGTRAYWTQNHALWSTDGTAEGVTQVFAVGSDTLTSAAAYNNAIYFGSNTQLYKSDGTTAGTQVLATVKVDASNGQWERGFHEMGGKLYFPCQMNGLGGEPCVTDGTAAGTKVVKDIRAGAAFSSPHFLGHLGNKLLFAAQSPASLYGLWVTDGTDVGTVQLLAPATNGDAIQNSEDDFAVLGGFAYVPCFTTATGFELCKTDGTLAGTSQVEVVAGATSGSPSGMAVLGTKLFFTATTAAAGRELWSSDGTTAGTALFKDFVAGTSDGATYGSKLAIGGTVYFTARTAITSSNELWKTDGTVAGTLEVKDILPAGKPERYGIELGVALGGKLVFAADDGVHGFEPWVTDGATTVQLEDMTPDTTAVQIFQSTTFANAGFFSVQDNTLGRSLWRSDGTIAGTKLFEKVDAYGLSVVGASLLYATTAALFKTDGTAPATKLRDVSGASEFQVAGGKLAFTGTTPQQTVGLWISDGTTTELTNPRVENARRLGVANGAFWLTGLQGANGNELWKSDGTTTTAVKDIRVGSGSSEPNNFAGVNGITVFAASDGVNGQELWKTDGTSLGTTLLADLRVGAMASGPFGMYTFKNMVLFWAASTAAYELWKTDGTAAGTTMLKAVPYGGDLKFVTWGDHVFFAATDPATGIELWRTDGTAAGTVQVADIYAGALSSNPTDLVLGTPTGPLYFAAEDAKSGRELWRLDTETGTPTLASDIVPGPQSSWPEALTIAGTYLVLAADDGSGYGVYSIKVGIDPSGDGAPGGPDGGVDPTNTDPSGCGCSSGSPSQGLVFCVAVLLVIRRRRSRFLHITS